MTTPPILMTTIPLRKYASQINYTSNKNESTTTDTFVHKPFLIKRYIFINMSKIRDKLEKYYFKSGHCDPS